MTRSIMVHIGHGKTGSSFLQSSLALNKDLLEAQNIRFPINPNQLAAAQQGKTTSGNQATFMGDVNTGVARFDPGFSYLYSGEGLFAVFATKPDVSDKLALIAKETGHEVKILLFIRDPDEYALSHYLQVLQMGRSVEDLDSFCRNHGAKLAHQKFENLRTIMNLCARHGFQLTLLNFSRERKSLLDHMARFIDLPPGINLASPDRPVNRSIGALEVGVQQTLSRSLAHIGAPRKSNYLKAVVDETSTMRFVPPSISADLLLQMGESIRTEMEAINQLLPDGQKYENRAGAAARQAEAPESGTEAQAHLRYGQLLTRAIIHAVISTILRHPALPPERLVDVAVNHLSPDLENLREYASIVEANGDLVQLEIVLRKLVKMSGGKEGGAKLARVLTELGRSDEAFRQARLAFKSNPKDTKNILSLFQIALQRGQFRSANQIIVRAAEHETPEHLLTGMRNKLSKARSKEKNTGFPNKAAAKGSSQPA
ncbi:MAG: tetratricopeptide repeat protein [Gemmobacter sp.]